MTRVCIVAAKRTPIGKFLGSLAARTAGELGAAAAKAALASANISPAKIDQVIVGNVLSAGLGQSVARQVGIGAPFHQGARVRHGLGHRGNAPVQVGSATRPYRETR